MPVVMVRDTMLGPYQNGLFEKTTLAFASSSVMLLPAFLVLPGRYFQIISILGQKYPFIPWVYILYARS
jgi:hypothetical protein